MNKLYKLYVVFGRLLFWLLLPIQRLFIRRTHRVYAVIVNGNKILLTKNWMSDDKWALPGGGVGKRESSEQALDRELDEELGIKASALKLKHIKSGYWRSHNLGFKYDMYIIRSEVTIGRVRKFEITEVSWVPKNDLNADNTASDILDVLQSSKFIDLDD